MEKTEYRNYPEPTGGKFFTKNRIKSILWVIFWGIVLYGYFWLLFSGC